MSTLGAETSLYDEDRGIQVPMTLEHVIIVGTQCCDNTVPRLVRPLHTFCFRHRRSIMEAQHDTFPEEKRCHRRRRAGLVCQLLLVVHPPQHRAKGGPRDNVRRVRQPVSVLHVDDVFSRIIEISTQQNMTSKTAKLQTRQTFRDRDSVTLIGYEFTTRTSWLFTGPLSTISSMLLRVTENPLFATSSSQMTLKNCCATEELLNVVQQFLRDALVRRVDTDLVSIPWI